MILYNPAAAGSISPRGDPHSEKLSVLERVIFNE